jgi:hypothetical protein
MGTLTREEEISLKELDHLQAMVARYDQFFFVNKQLSLTAFGAVLYAYLIVGKPVAWLMPFIPISFFFIEFAFRYQYWSKRIFRIREVRQFLQGNSNGVFQVYAVSATADDPRRRFWESLKAYDLLIYAGMLIISIALAFFVVRK